MAVYSDGVMRVLGNWAPTEGFPLDPCPDAIPMTKAETIMRREEALEMRWPLFLVDAIEAKLMGTWAPQEGHRLYGGSPNGSMVDTFCSGLHPIKWSDGWPA